MANLLVRVPLERKCVPGFSGRLQASLNYFVCNVRLVPCRMDGNDDKKQRSLGKPPLLFLVALFIPTHNSILAVSGQAASEPTSPRSASGTAAPPVVLPQA
eukprot:4112788-Amphidinium_carterae.1